MLFFSEFSINREEKSDVVDSDSTLVERDEALRGEKKVQ